MVVSHTVVWHDLECGSYSADLPLWRELAGAGARVLDVGAGTGRVALDLARHGHAVTALDRDEELLEVLRDRAAAQGLDAVETAHADARDFTLAHGDYGICLVPMQTLQLLGGAASRAAFLACARRHLLPGGLLACAIVTEVEPFDSAAGDPALSPEVCHVDGESFASRPTRVRLGKRAMHIERHRTIGASVPERDVVELDLVSVRQLHGEGLDAGLTPAGTRTIPATREHTASTVVMFRA